MVGSGYGASVAALRLAERGGAVAVLERGREWLPGDFPTDLAGLALEVRSALRPLGLLDHRTALGAEVDVIGASGLGGTSLINAAISVRPRPDVFALPEWPAALQRDAESGALERDFARAEAMLRPLAHPDVATVRRSRIHLETAAPGRPRGALPLNIHHGAAEERHGVRVSGCIGCGNCCGGCNVGAKRTLTTSYLPAAVDRGAQIFCGVEVTHLEKLPETRSAARWLVHLVIHETSALGVTTSTPGQLTARHVWLGAGSAGTTEILFASERAGLPLSPRLGTRLSANGDVLGAAYNAARPIGAMPFVDPRPGSTEERVGPTISTFVDLRAAGRPLAAQFLLLDGVIPRPFVPVAARLLAVHPRAIAGASDAAAVLRLGRDALALAYPPPDGALAHTMILLACGHDSSGGHYVADDGGFHARWPGVADEPSFRLIREEMARYAASLGATFLPNPRGALDDAVQATHPLGGAPMGETPDRGVVAHDGSVFAPDGAPHAGLFVIDAAAIPRSLAAPPLLTLTALAERALRLATK